MSWTSGWRMRRFPPSSSPHVTCGTAHYERQLPGGAIQCRVQIRREPRPLPCTHGHGTCPRQLAVSASPGASDVGELWAGEFSGVLCTHRRRYDAPQDVPQRALIALRERRRPRAAPNTTAQTGARGDFAPAGVSARPLTRRSVRVRATFDQAARFEAVDQPGDIGRIGLEPLRQLAHRDRPLEVELV